MEKETKRSQFGGSIGFILSAIGSAVGLGNIWGFPYKMGNNGGFAFLIVYVLLAVFVGMFIMIAELAIGRKTGKSVVSAFGILNKKFKWVGWMGVIVPFVIMGFYNVLGGYCTEYLFFNLSNLAFGSAGADGGTLFGGMLTNQFGSIIFSVIYLAICFFIVKGGVKGGIEKFNKIGMPALFVMLVIIVIRSCSLPGATEGIEYILKPNFEPFKENFFGVLATAGGQMFFSLSLAMGIMVTFGSYLSKKESIVKNSLFIIGADTLVALLAAFAVIPAAFALGGQDAAMAGPKLLFITLQDVFNSMGTIGPLFGSIFYLLVVLAAISSTISLIEVVTSFLIDRQEEKGKTANRGKITFWSCAAISILTIIVALDGLGANGFWVPTQNALGVVGSFNDCWLDFLDFFTEGLMMPLAALITSIFVGWVIKPKAIFDEVTLEGNKFKLYGAFKFCIRFIIPVVMGLVLLGQIDTFLALGIFS